MRGEQVKLCYPFTMHVIPERLSEMLRVEALYKYFTFTFYLLPLSWYYYRVSWRRVTRLETVQHCSTNQTRSTWSRITTRWTSPSSRADTSTCSRSGSCGVPRGSRVTRRRSNSSWIYRGMIQTQHIAVMLRYDTLWTAACSLFCRTDNPSMWCDVMILY